MPLGAFRLNGLGKTQVSSSVTYTVKNTLTGIDRTADNAFGHYHCGYLGDDSSQNPCFAMAYKDNSDGIVKVVAFMVSKTTGALTIGTPASSALVGQDPYLKTENQDAQLRKTSSWSAAGVFSFYYNTAARLRIGAFTVNLSTLAVTIGTLVQETTQTGAGVSVITYVDNNRFVVTHRGNVGQYRVSELFSRSGTTLTSVVSGNNTGITSGGFPYDSAGFVYASATPMYRFAYSGVGNNYSGSEYTTAKFDNTTLRVSNTTDVYTTESELNTQTWMLNLDTATKGCIISQENNLNFMRARALDITWSASGTNPSHSFGTAISLNQARTPHTLTAINNAQVDTAQSKFGGASLLLDGAGDVLLANPTTDMVWGTSSDFTYECFVRFNSTAATYIFDQRTAFGTAAVALLYDVNALDYYQGGTRRINYVWTPTLATWYHVAICRGSGTTRLFVDGVQRGSFSDTLNYVQGNSNLYIGGWWNNSSTATGFNGWIDEVRVSSIARYTAGFTPTTSAFTNDSNTILLVHCNGTDATTTFTDDNA